MRLKITRIQLNFVPAEDRALMKAFSIIIVNELGKLGDRGLARIMKISFDNCFKENFHQDNFKKFIDWEKKSEHGVLAGPSGNVSDMTFIRSKNINTRLKHLIDLYSPVVKQSLELAKREEDPVLQLLGLN